MRRLSPLGVTLLSGLLLVAAPRLCFGDGVTGWPQFRGEDGQGNLGQVALPIQWDQSNIRWRTEIPGLGHASPVHDGTTVWLATASHDGHSLGAVAIDLASGRLTRQVSVFHPRNVEEIHKDNSYASPTPVLEDGRLYLHFGTYGTACLDAATGKVLWKNEEFHIEHEGGPGSSPVMFENLLILTCDGANEQFLVALDAKSGRVVWKQPRTSPLRPNPTTHRAFSTPLVMLCPNGYRLISPGADQCHAYDPRTGGEIWHVRYTGFSTVPSPVADGTACYFCTGFFQPQLLAVRLGGSGDVTDSHTRWTAQRTISETPSPTLHEGRLYVVSNLGVLTCFHCETGEREWVYRLGGNYSASPLIAGGYLYACSEEGAVKIVDLSAKPTTAVVHHFQERIMASPAVVGNDLLIRTDQALYRVGN